MALTKNVAFFSGTDSSNKSGLWVSDGTVAGTFEIGGPADAGVTGVSSAAGLDPGQTLPVFHTTYFSGVDANNNFTLWVSDGTAAGTVEIGGLDNQGIAGASAAFSPTDLVQYRGKVLFNAKDSSGGSGLWITDGTAAGTTEIGGLNDQGVTNANVQGLNPNNAIVFNGKIYFEGEDSSPGNGLWVSDGTAAGTTEVGGLGSAGIAGALVGGLNPSSLAVASGRLFFGGEDSSFGLGLWVSDGTAAGTSEIGGPDDQGVSGAAAGGLDPLNAIQLNGKVFFRGNDSSGQAGLWVSDGTAAGTVELGGLKNQGITGAGPNGLVPLNFGRLGNKLLFSAIDASNSSSLWVTDGTVAGTTEIGGLQNAGIAGAHGTGFNPGSFTALGGKALFRGVDSSGNSGLWVTDGTAAGTIELGGLQDQAINGVATFGLNPVAVGAPATVTGTSDFNGDFYSDVLWRNASGGLADWSMNAGAIVSGALSSGGVAVNPGASWSVAAIADFDGSGSADVLWRNSDGTLADWSMNGSSIVSSVAPTSGGIAVKPDASWSVAGTGDFNGDSTADILWRNTSGEISEWQMNGADIIGSGDLTSGGVAVKPDASWSVAGVGDFDGDGKKDILWRNASGEVSAWLMNGTTITGSADLTSGGVAVKPDASWSVAGIGDFNGDGNADVLWRNTNGSLSEWLMTGATIISSNAITFNGTAVTPDASWHVVQIGDFNGDGQSDMLWRNDAGALSEWLMNGTTIMQSLTPASNGAAISPDASWSTQVKPTNFG